MLIIPAIDLKDGRCVRLVQGQLNQSSIYPKTPVEMAHWFVKQGAQRLHVVDLDGAFSGQPANLDSIRAIRKAVDMHIELGGGVRSLAQIEMLFDLGIDSVIIGTLAIQQPDVVQQALTRYGSDKIIIGIDARRGQVAIEGWVEETPWNAEDFAKHWKQQGATEFIFTDVSRDGMLNGPNLESLESFAIAAQATVTASGGVSTANDVLQLRTLMPLGVSRVIIGKAIYENQINLAEVINAC